MKTLVVLLSTLALAVGSSFAEGGKKLVVLIAGKPSHGPGQHILNTFRNVLLQKQNAQGGASLAGTPKGGGHHISNDLLRQGGAINDHGVLSARFRHQQKSLKDYFLGGRSTPWWAIAFSIVSAA